MGLQPSRRSVSGTGKWGFSSLRACWLRPRVLLSSPPTLRLNLLAEPPLVAIPSFCLPFTVLGPSDFGLLCRVCSWLICRNWQLSGVGRSVRIACCLFVVYLLYVLCLLLCIVYCWTWWQESCSDVVVSWTA